MSANAAVKSSVIDPTTVSARTGSSYPAPFAKAVAGRIKRALGDACGLENFGVNLTELPPGAWSSQRHWHLKQDEFVYVLEGELVLVTDAGETLLRAGMAAGFPANNGDGHHLINRSDRNAIYLEIGDRSSGDGAVYPDIDLTVKQAPDGKWVYSRRDGTPY